jgi:uncharacterized protein YaiI (UPF0178 family)
VENELKIYVDADACPKVIKEHLYKVVRRLEIDMVLVADQSFQIPQSPHISFLTVPSGIDAADEKIVDMVNSGDVVITADIPLADQVVSKGAYAINPRGELYTEQNIKERLAIRDMMAEMRSSGLEFGGPPSFNSKDKQTFANQLDKLLTKLTRSSIA